MCPAHSGAARSLLVQDSDSTPLHPHVLTVRLLFISCRNEGCLCLLLLRLTCFRPICVSLVGDFLLVFGESSRGLHVVRYCYRPLAAC